MQRLYRVESVRRIEAHWLAQWPAGTLMRRAASAVADEVERLIGTAGRGLGAVAIVGPGSNGADALLAAVMLRDRGHTVRAIGLPAQVATGENARVRQAWADQGGELEPPEVFEQACASCDVVVDGMFGIGLTRPLDSTASALARRIEAAGVLVVAVDVPSGLDASTGAVVGPKGSIAVKATTTVTMIADKPGLHTGAALDHVGRLVVADLGLGDEHCAAAAAPDGSLVTGGDVRHWLPPRAQDSHKGTFGSVLVAGGAATMQGAALLAASGAQACGAGKVFIASPHGGLFDPGHPHWMTSPWPPAPGDFDAIAVGCGLGRHRSVIPTLDAVLSAPTPAVLDADALSLIAADTGLFEALARRRAASVITPHPLEAARLLGIETSRIQTDRIDAACVLAARTSSVVVLKGAGSVVAEPGGAWGIVDSGAPTLATAGTGDVLAGMIAALLAQGLPAGRAARIGAWLHGRAGELALAEMKGATGFSAGELAAYIRRVLPRT